MKESDLYLPVKDFFEKKDFQVYAEVSVNYTRGRIDLVAYDGETAVAVEMKTALSNGLIEQAIQRKKIFPVVFVAIPMRKREIPFDVQLRLGELGIGILEVYWLGHEPKVKVRQHAYEREPTVKLRKKWDEILRPEHQTWVPGGHSGGGYVTEYSLTMKGIHDFLKSCRLQAVGNDYSSAWRSTKEISDNCKTHFASPKAQIGPALLDYETEWAEAKKVAGRWFFRHKEGSQKYEK